MSQQQFNSNYPTPQNPAPMAPQPGYNPNVQPMQPAYPPAQQPAPNFGYQPQQPQFPQPMGGMPPQGPKKGSLLPLWIGLGVGLLVLVLAGGTIGFLALSGTFSRSSSSASIASVVSTAKSSVVSSVSDEEEEEEVSSVSNTSTASSIAGSTSTSGNFTKFETSDYIFFYPKKYVSSTTSSWDLTYQSTSEDQLIVFTQYPDVSVATEADCQIAAEKWVDTIDGATLGTVKFTATKNYPKCAVNYNSKVDNVTFHCELQMITDEVKSNIYFLNIGYLDGTSSTDLKDLRDAQGMFKIK